MLRHCGLLVMSSVALKRFATPGSSHAALAVVLTPRDRQYDLEKGYYADKEDAYAMRLQLRTKPVEPDAYVSAITPITPSITVPSAAHSRPAALSRCAAERRP